MAHTRLRLAALALAGLALLTPGCRPRAEKAEAPAPTATAEPAPAPTPVIPAPAPALGRAELLAAASAATDAYAAGRGAPEAVTAIAGRRFVVRLPFGCGGPGPDDATVGYAYDAEKQTLRLSARPEVWTQAPWARALVGDAEMEAIEGFWIRRPWLSAETCPAWTASATAGETPALVRSPDTLGLAQVFEEGGSRLVRRGGRGYQVTVKADADALHTDGFRLVLEGRIGAADAGGPIRCRSGGPDQRPVCLIMVEFDRVAFESAAAEMLAEWTT